MHSWFVGFDFDFRFTSVHSSRSVFSYQNACCTKTTEAQHLKHRMPLPSSDFRGSRILVLHRKFLVAQTLCWIAFIQISCARVSFLFTFISCARAVFLFNFMRWDWGPPALKLRRPLALKLKRVLEKARHSSEQMLAQQFVEQRLSRFLARALHSFAISFLVRALYSFSISWDGILQLTTTRLKVEKASGLEVKTCTGTWKGEPQLWTAGGANNSLNSIIQISCARCIPFQFHFLRARGIPFQFHGKAFYSWGPPALTTKCGCVFYRFHLCRRKR